MQSAFWILEQSDNQSKTFFDRVARVVEKDIGEVLSL